MPTNAELRHLRRLHEERYRRDAGEFVIEGDKSVGEFLKSARFQLTLYALDSWSGAATDVVRVSSDEMARISHFPSPPDVLAVGRVLIEPIAPGSLNEGLTLALDTVQDPGNVGTILRTADWFGVDRVVLGEGCADPFSQKAVNASKGSLARVRVHKTDLPAALEQTQAEIVIRCRWPRQDHAGNAGLRSNCAASCAPWFVRCCCCSSHRAWLPPRARGQAPCLRDRGAV